MNWLGIRETATYLIAFVSINKLILILLYSILESCVRKQDERKDR
jgi:hypothetical protein